MKLKEISVFFPAYNEVDNIEHTVVAAKEVLQQVAKKWEIIVVDDGSVDGTGDVVKSLVSRDKKIKLVAHNPNQGYGAAIKTGLSQSKYELICYTDSDGQFEFSEVGNFIKELNKGADLVIGYRMKRTDNIYRRFMAKVLRLVGIFLFRINVKDVDCGFKLLKRKVLDRVGLLRTASAITETELVTRVKRAGFVIAEVGVRHHSRMEGEQTGGRPEVIIKAAIEGVKLWWMLTFTKS